MLIHTPINFKDGSTNYMINDQTALLRHWDAVPNYYIRCSTQDGLYGTDIDSEAHPIPHSIGEKSGDSFRRGKGITLGGSIEGPNLHAIEDGIEHLMEMFWKTTPRPLIWNKRGTDVYYTCRVLNDLVVTPQFEQYQPTATWTVGLRADDPRLRKVSDNSLYYSWQT